MFLPGRTSDGHHQIESECAVCHDPFGGAKDAACLACHGESLRARNDSHAPAKFDDPARAAQVALVDARSCVACHREHRAEARLRGSVTVATNFCVACHGEIRQERPDHAELSDSGCASAGCHNYHDNRALYGDFLVKDLGGPDLRADPRVPLPASFPAPGSAPWASTPPRPDVLPANIRAPGCTSSTSSACDEVNLLPAIAEWSGSAHARGKVNCSGCHQQPAPAPAGAAPPAGKPSVWSWSVEDSTCASCHRDERLGFRAGKHGMRLTASLGAMSPALARAPMKAQATPRSVGCTSCHGAHRFDRVQAAVESCEGCHDDEHTRRYRASPHFASWQKEQRQEAPAGSGVSCATCHLPRLSVKQAGIHR